MDREKVIKEWEKVLSRDPLDAPWDLIDDTLTLLKKQEPLAVYEGKVNKCVCGNGINRYWHPEYCGFCGKKLKWY